MNDQRRWDYWNKIHPDQTKWDHPVFEVKIENADDPANLVIIIWLPSPGSMRIGQGAHISRREARKLAREIDKLLLLEMV